MIKKLFVGILLFLINCLFIVSCLIYFSVDWVFKTWVNLTMDELMYTITSPLDGTNTEMIKDYCSYCIAPVMLLTLLLIIVAIGYYVKKRQNRLFLSIGYSIISVLSLGMLYSSVSEAYERLDIKNY